MLKVLYSIMYSILINLVNYKINLRKKDILLNLKVLLKQDLQ